MCRSQQVNKSTEKLSSSDEECSLIQSFDSRDEFEIMSIEQNTASTEQIDAYIKQPFKQKTVVGETGKEIRKVEIRRKP